MTYQLPTDIFDSVDNIQTYTLDQIQREISHNPDLNRINIRQRCQRGGH